MGWTTDIQNERARQDAKWGAERNLDPFVWLAILTEEVGEVAQAILQHTTDEPGTLQDARKELVQVAAVAIQFMEALDRRILAESRS